MTRTQKIGFASLALFILTGCATNSTTSNAKIEDFETTEQAAERFVVLRGFVLRNAPNLEAQSVQTFSVGDSFYGYDKVTVNEEWRYLDIESGAEGYVFGAPYSLAEK